MVILDSDSGQPNTVSVWFWQNISGEICFGFRLLAFSSFGDLAERGYFGQKRLFWPKEAILAEEAISAKMTFGQKRMFGESVLFILPFLFSACSLLCLLFSVSLSAE